MDVVFLLDSSKESLFNDMKDFVKSFAHKFVVEPSSTRVALITYGSDASIIFGFTRYCCRKELDEALDKMDYPSFVSRRSETHMHQKRGNTWKRFLQHAKTNSTHLNHSNTKKNENGKWIS